MKMNKKLLSLFLTIALMLVFAAPAAAQEPFENGRVVFGESFTLEADQTMDGDMVVFGGSATIDEDAVLDGSLAVFGGSAQVDGQIDGDVVAFGGSVTINGEVDGDVASMGGNVNINEGALVDGEVGSFGGQTNVQPGATIDGRFSNGFAFGPDHDRENRGERDERVAPDAPERPESAQPPVPPAAPNHFNDDNRDFRYGHDYNDGPFGGIPGFIFLVVNDIFWTMSLLVVLGLITWLVAAFMPEQMLTVRRTIGESTALSFGLGLLTTVIAGVVGLFLLITICLAFIPIIVYIFLAIAALFGWIVIGQMLGERLLLASGRSDPGFVFSSILGVVVLTLLTNMPVIGQIPCLGWLLWLVAGLIGTLLSLTGLGAVLLTRFGTRPYPPEVYGGGFSGGGSGPRSSGGGFSSGPRVRWTDPAPDVSDEAPLDSEEELKARIKEALAEADKMEPKQPDLSPDKDKPADEPDSDYAPKTPEDDVPDDKPKTTG